MKPNLEFIRENGIKKWLSAQKKEWSCPGCGAGINWYQKRCSCGLQLKAWDVPA
jgi:hypothetical protein